jgi:hypothetical protein
VLEECITEELSTEAHLAAMDGGDDPYTDCPECSLSTYVFSEECCVACEYKHQSKTCLVCSTTWILMKLILGTYVTITGGQWKETTKNNILLLLI